ncbi:CLIP domain-containing serine protease 2-like [Contarinia nasturtii]|uniref:CLIP domain-containing serine protease 2-like n=1 Tax=Contarinia nasturtii TaxID=265458 RepID=UPI0012D40340|nr:CLIP domain-containing serine protease 2-like [Contarinia nasturtii]
MLKLIVTFSMYCLLATGSDQDYQLHKNWPKQMERGCGETYADRIVGGKYAKLGQYPWMAQLLYKERNDQLISLCGGSLVTPFHVISAAHCVHGKELASKLDSVGLGDYDIKTDPDCEEDICAEPKQVIKIAKVIMPDTYSMETMKDDISVLILESQAILNGWVNAICLPTGREQIGGGGGVGEVAGWGISNIKTRSSEHILNYVKLPLLDMDYCRDQTKLPVSGKTQLCAGSTNLNQDSCNGDSGGPLMQIANSINGGPRYYITGIVSYGPIACGIAPAVYTKVSSYMDFILNAMH